MFYCHPVCYIFQHICFIVTLYVIFSNMYVLLSPCMLYFPIYMFYCHPVCYIFQHICLIVTLYVIFSNIYVLLSPCMLYFPTYMGPFVDRIRIGKIGSVIIAHFLSINFFSKSCYSFFINGLPMRARPGIIIDSLIKKY